MELRQMALLTQPGRAIFQHRLMHRAVGLVTDRAILAHWRMFPQERPAFFRVAGIAGFVNRSFDQLLRSGGAVGIVAIGTGHLPVLQGVARWAQHLGALFLVTGEAQRGLAAFIENLVFAGMHSVTTGAGQVLGFVNTTAPVGREIPLVALQTLGVLGCSGRGIAAECDVWLGAGCASGGGGAMS